MSDSSDVLSWVHFGDLHLTEAGAQNHRDFLALIDVVNRHTADRASFALLPGDNADDGSEAQFRLVREAVDELRMPLHIIPGDHDFHTGSLDAYHRVLGAERLPRSTTVDGCRCLFLDIVSSGTGGPDFRLDEGQLDWIDAELKRAETAGESAAIFMHAYPADLRAGADRLRALLAQHRVACVDMGHTHYNELANDGRTIFMATRSTGQIEEGPAGFSIGAVDHGVACWRFQPLDGAWPLVLITRPADHRLVTDPTSPDQVVGDVLRVAAKVFGAHEVASVVGQVDDAAPVPFWAVPGAAGLWSATCDARVLAAGRHRLLVRATEATGAVGEETISFLTGPDSLAGLPKRHADGSDRDAIGAWPEKHLLGTQLGPNRNGRKW